MRPSVGIRVAHQKLVTLCLWADESNKGHTNVKTTLKKAALRSATCLSAFAVVCAGQVAHAQDTAEAAATDGEAIVVTGSRIVRRNLDSAAPVAVVSSEEFKLSGAVNVESVINTLPQVIPGTTAFSNNPGGGVATLDLRGLGEERTMVLVNGRRWMFYDANQITDLNTIPSFLIESVDVVTGGASAVYGSDAISGVVNFRLKNVQGVEAGGQYSITGEGDGPRYNAYLALGSEFADGRGHATVYAEYYNRKGIYQGARDFSDWVASDDGEGGFVAGGSPTTPQGRLTSLLPRTSSVAGTVTCPVGNVFCSPGAYYSTPGVSRPYASTDAYNYGPDNLLMVPQERYSIGGYADYEIGDGHTAYIEASFINNRVDNVLAATPVTGTFQVDIASVSPFLSASDIAALNQLDGLATSTNTAGDGVVPLSVSRRITETGGRRSADERNAFRTLVGIKGPINDAFSYDAYYMYARTRNSNLQYGNISRSAFAAGLNGSAPAINIFGPNTLTSDMVDQISILAQNGDVSTLQVANAAISGSLFNFGMGGDDVGIAFGAEYRKVGGEFVPDTALSSGDVIGFNAGDPTAGSYNVKEFFAEIRAPIAANMAGIERLELTGAVRYSDYSLGAVGGTWTYAGGVEYSPIRDITFRGQYQRAVRAPNVQELFGGQSIGFPAAVDPCGEKQTQELRTEVVRALCLATGVPAGSEWTDAVQASNDEQIQGLFGGNPDLQEETSDSWTAGVVVRPTFVPGLSLTVDWFNIKIEDAIGTYGGGLANTLDLCYNVIQDINSGYCQTFVGTRNALGELDGENPPAILNANTSSLKTEGIDFELNYGTDLAFGLINQDSRIGFNFLATYTDSYIYVPVADMPEVEYNCAGKFGTLNCGNPIPKWKWTSRLSWMDGPLTTSIRWRHLNSVKDDNPSIDYTVEKIGSYDVFDLTLSAMVKEGVTISMGMNNVFDKKPEILGGNQEQANTYPGTYDVLGRDFFISAQFSF